MERPQFTAFALAATLTAYGSELVAQPGFFPKEIRISGIFGEPGLYRRQQVLLYQQNSLGEGQHDPV